MAYTQKFGRPSLGGNGEPFAEKGLITPTDPKPNEVVVSSDDLTFANGVRNELPAVTLGTVKNTKKKVDRPKSLRNSILDNTADDSYSMYNTSTNKATQTKVDPISGTNFEQTTYSNPATNYTASLTSGNKSVSTSSSRYPGESTMTSTHPYASSASNYVGEMPSTRQGGFQETYTDNNFIRNTRTGKQIIGLPKNSEPTNQRKINALKKHQKDSVRSRQVRIDAQVRNERTRDRANLLKQMIKKNL